MQTNVASIILHSCKVYSNNIAICCINKQQQLIVLSYNQLVILIFNLVKILEKFENKFIITTINEGINGIVTFLAIFFTNKIAVPVDRNDPRLADIKEETKGFVLTESFIESFINTTTTTTDDNIDNIHASLLAMIQSISLDSLCYMIYTSGSTGKPKGVLVEHQNIMCFMNAKIQGQNIDENSRVFLCTAFTFDPYIGDALATLQAGGTICLAPKTVMHSSLHSCLYKTKATHVFATPTMWSTINTRMYHPDTLPCLRCLALGGEQMKQEQLEIWGSNKKLTLINTYGATEATVVQMQYICNDDNNNKNKNKNNKNRSCVGKAMHGNKIFIIDPETKTNNNTIYGNNLKLLPVGKIGEIVFAGMQITRGYYKRPELTNKKYFQMSKFSNDDDNDSDNNNNGTIRCFRSGDLGKIDEKDGTLQLFGRIDNQVKIRGYRVELEEIEHVCLQSCLVKECVCTIEQSNEKDNQLLIVYIIPATKNIWSWAHTSTLRSYFLRVLPAYMQPHKIVALKDQNALPKTTSMKIDRKILKKIDPILTAKPNETPPVTKVEVAISKVWSIITGTTQISRYDHFFRLGGDSLGALRCVRLLWKDYISKGEETLYQKTSQYGDIDSVLSPSLLIKFPILKDFAVYIEKSGLNIIDDNTTPTTNSKNKKRKEEENTAVMDENMLALREASRCGYLDVIKFLLFEEKVDPNCSISRKKPGTTPLHLACNVQVVNILYENGAKLTLPAPGGILPIHYAASKDATLLKRFIELNVPLLAQDQNKQIAIHFAARSGNVESVQLLILENEKMKKTFLDSLDRWNRCPLHWAILNNHYEVVVLLIKAGARIFPYNMSKIKHLENLQGHRTRLPLELPIDMAIRMYGMDSSYYTLLKENSGAHDNGDNL